VVRISFVDGATRCVRGVPVGYAAGFAAGIAMATMLAFGGPAFGAEAQGIEMDPAVKQVPHDPGEFRADPSYQDEPYDPAKQVDIYGGKVGYDEPRPLLELGRRQYTSGLYDKGTSIFGEDNLVFQALSVYGDWRTAVAFNNNGGKELAQVATRLNLDVDYKITATERLHAFVRPFDRGGKFTRCEFAGDDSSDDCDLEVDFNIDTFFFEGDLASIYAGLTGSFPRLDMPFTVGLVPFFFQNGLWVNDAFWGAAYTIPARNIPALDISNMDITFFGGWDKFTNPGILDINGRVADHNTSVMGVTAFVDALQGYWEGGYAFVNTQNSKLFDQDFHSLTLSFTKRYFDRVSNSVRAFWSFGQDPAPGVRENAEGFALLVENSLVTSLPSTLVPYLNLFIGFDRPQPLASATGLLINTGINFETDGLTGFPLLDDTAHSAYGGALGVQYLFGLDQQVVFEFATVQPFGSSRAAVDDQYALGVRWQLPITKAWILRADAMYGLLKEADDLAGIRFEVRRKF